MFLAAGLVVAFLVGKTADWIWGIFARPNDMIILAGSLIAGILTVILLWRSNGVAEKAGLVVSELFKITWPTKPETQAATIVVIITTVVISLILGVFDAVWSWGSSLIY